MQGKNRAIRRIVMAGCALALVMGLAACGDDQAGPGAPGASTTSGSSTAGTTTETAPLEVTAWFPALDREQVVPVALQADGPDLLEAALGALEGEPGDPELGRALPEGTKIVSVQINAGTARVDLSPEFAEGYPAGSAAEILALAPIVYTATGIAGVERVLITVGARAPDVASQFDLRSPLSRTDLPSDIAGQAP